jgi:hypothetical protein
MEGNELTRTALASNACQVLFRELAIDIFI